MVPIYDIESCSLYMNGLYTTTTITYEIPESITDFESLIWITHIEGHAVLFGLGFILLDLNRKFLIIFKLFITIVKVIAKQYILKGNNHAGLPGGSTITPL